MVLESPFYGQRQPGIQTGSRLQRVSDLLTLGRATLEESLFLLDWASQQRASRLGVYLDTQLVLETLQALTTSLWAVSRYLLPGHLHGSVCDAAAAGTPQQVSVGSARSHGCQFSRVRCPFHPYSMLFWTIWAISTLKGVQYVWIPRTAVTAYLAIRASAAVHSIMLPLQQEPWRAANHKDSCCRISCQPVALRTPTSSSPNAPHIPGSSHN